MFILSNNVHIKSLKYFIDNRKLRHKFFLTRQQDLRPTEPRGEDANFRFLEGEFTFAYSVGSDFNQGRILC